RGTRARAARRLPPPDRDGRQRVGGALLRRRPHHVPVGCAGRVRGGSLRLPRRPSRMGRIAVRSRRRPRPPNQRRRPPPPPRRGGRRRRTALTTNHARARRSRPMQNDPRFTVNRRQLRTLTGAAGLTGLTAACGGPGTTTAPSSPEGPDTEGPAEGEVSFAHWRAEDKEVFDELIADFESENSGITISQTISTSTDYEAQALRRMRAGAIGDVTPAFRGTQFERFVESGLFVDLSDTDLVSRYNPSLITVGEQHGKQYGFPYQVVFNVPIANMDILESVGVQESPQDWDSYIEMLEAIKAKGITPIAFPGADAGNAGQLFNAMIMN